MDTDDVKDWQGQGTMQLPGMGPEPGDLFANRHTGQICCLLEIIQKRGVWYRIRTGGRTTLIGAVGLAENWVPYRIPPPQD